MMDTDGAQISRLQEVLRWQSNTKTKKKSTKCLVWTEFILIFSLFVLLLNGNPSARLQRRGNEHEEARPRCRQNGGDAPTHRKSTNNIYIKYQSSINIIFKLYPFYKWWNYYYYYYYYYSSTCCSCGHFGSDWPI